MKNKVLKIMSVLFALLFTACVPLSAFAASYANKATVSISCKKTKTYNFETTEGLGTSLAGSLKFKKGGATSADSVTLTTLNPMYGKVRYMRVSITTTDNKTHTVQKKVEIVNGNKTKITITEDGKVTSQKTYAGLYEYHKAQTITVKGTLWKAAKSVYSSANVTGADSSSYIYFKT